jgi:hypothetical protein
MAEYLFYEPIFLVFGQGLPLKLHAEVLVNTRLPVRLSYLTNSHDEDPQNLIFRNENVV